MLARIDSGAGFPARGLIFGDSREGMRKVFANTILASQGRSQRRGAEGFGQLVFSAVQTFLLTAMPLTTYFTVNEQPRQELPTPPDYALH